MAATVMHTVTRALSWTAGMIEGMMSSVVGNPPADRSLPNLLKRGRLADVRAALVGRHRKRIARVLGAPPTACVRLGQCVAGAGPMTYWQASTWYYPLDNRRQAIAIQFDGNCAKRVEFIGVE